MISVSCFGEILWDVFPSYRRIGGAPLNVAMRMHAMGAQVHMISKLGNDDNGKQILSFLENQKFPTGLIQIDPGLRTGTVDVHLDETRMASYTINKPSAWDAIELTGEMQEVVESSDALIFGSLSCRSPESRETLKSLLKSSSFKVFDMNLRPPHYELDQVVNLLHLADLVKMNDEELDEIVEHLNLSGKDVSEKMNKLKQVLAADTTLCVTLGAEGAKLLRNNQVYSNKGYKVKVADTVGAGDSFLAALCFHLLKNTPPQEALDRACALGSLVASKEGAIAPVSDEEVENLMKKT